MQNCLRSALPPTCETVSSYPLKSAVSYSHKMTASSDPTEDPRHKRLGVPLFRRVGLLSLSFWRPLLDRRVVTADLTVVGAVVAAGAA